MKNAKISRQFTDVCKSIRGSFSRTLRVLKRSYNRLLGVSSNINLQLTGLMIAILVSGFVFSARLDYIHNSRLYDMSTYSYARLAEVQSSAQKEVYRELATKYLIVSEDYRQAAARTTDMFISSTIAIALLFVAILMTLSGQWEYSQFLTLLSVAAALLFLLLTLLLWFPWPPLEPLRWGDLVPGMVRELPRWDFIDQLIRSTGYLQQILQDK